MSQSRYPKLLLFMHCKCKYLYCLVAWEENLFNLFTMCFVK